MHGPATKKDIRDSVNSRDIRVINFALDTMLADRRVLKFGTGKNVRFQINPHFSHLEAAE